MPLGRISAAGALAAWVLCGAAISGGGLVRGSQRMAGSVGLALSLLFSMLFTGAGFALFQ